jgi:hypothetical protein
MMARHAFHADILREQLGRTTGIGVLRQVTWVMFRRVKSKHRNECKLRPVRN